MELDAAVLSRSLFAESTGTFPVPFAAALPPGLEILAERLEDYARAAKGAFADNTLRALAADSRVFGTWCAAAGRTMLPATPDTIVAFIDVQAETKSRATVERYRSSIAALHRAAGLPNPCANEIVLLAVKRMSRSKGRRQKQAESLIASPATAPVKVPAAASAGSTCTWPSTTTPGPPIPRSCPTRNAAPASSSSSTPCASSGTTASRSNGS